MLDWYDKIIIAICMVAVVVIIGVIIVGVGVEPSSEEFDVVGWVANPANPSSPLHPKF